MNKFKVGYETTATKTYKANPTIGKTPTDKSDSLKVDIKTQPGERNIKTVAIYVPLFWTGIPEALLKFVTILHKIIQGQDLLTVPQKFSMERNLVIGEALQVFIRRNERREQVSDEGFYPSFLSSKSASAPE